MWKVARWSKRYILPCLNHRHEKAASLNHDGTRLLDLAQTGAQRIVYFFEGMTIA